MSAQRTWSFLLSSLLLAAGLVAVASPAAAENAAIAADAVPGEVVTYIATELVDDLNEFYGPGIDGNGRLFTNTTTASAATRVYEFTPDFLAGVEADPPVRRVNEWVSVISIDAVPVGFAVILIEPATSTPQLAAFTESEGFGIVLATLPATALLVHDVGRAAWLWIDEEKLTPILAGTSGLTEPADLADYRELVRADASAVADAAPALENNSSGLNIAALILVVIVLLLAAEASLPYLRRRAAARHPADPEPEATDATPTSAD